MPKYDKNNKKKRKECAMKSTKMKKLLIMLLTIVMLVQIAMPMAVMAEPLEQVAEVAQTYASIEPANASLPPAIPNFGAGGGTRIFPVPALTTITRPLLPNITRNAWQQLNYLVDNARGSDLIVWENATTNQRIIEVQVDINFGNSTIDIGDGFSRANVHIRSADPNNPVTLTQANNQRHFHVHPGSTLILENIILCGGEGRTSNPYATNAGSGGGVYIQRSGTLSPRPEAQFWMLDDAVIQNSRQHINRGLFQVLINGNTTFGGAVEIEGGHFRMLGGTIQHNLSEGVGGGVAVRDRGTFEMWGGEIKHNRALQATHFSQAAMLLPPFTVAPVVGMGGGVFVETQEAGLLSGLFSDVTSSFTMNGGTIYDNTAALGGGVYVRGRSNNTLGVELRSTFYGVFTMNGGQIIGNTARVDATQGGSNPNVAFPRGMGGGVRACSDGMFIFNDGLIDGNDARVGGGVSLGYNNFIRTALRSINGEWTTCSPGEMRMHGGTISNNTALRGGGVSIYDARRPMPVLIVIAGVFGDPTQLAMYGGTIDSNTATQDGGGIWVRHNNRLFLGNTLSSNHTGSSRPTISNNEAGRNGGGMFLRIDTCFIADQVSFIGNHAELDGGAMHLPNFEYRNMLSSSAYRPGRSNRFAVTSNVIFSENSAGNGAWTPPYNAATVGRPVDLIYGAPRFPVAASRSLAPGTPIEMRHQLNNFDINFRGTILYDPDYTPTPSCICCRPDYMGGCMHIVDPNHNCNDEQYVCTCGDNCDCWTHCGCCPEDCAVPIRIYEIINDEMVYARTVWVCSDYLDTAHDENPRQCRHCPCRENGGVCHCHVPLLPGDDPEDVRISVLNYFSLAIPGEYRAIPNDVVVGDVYGFFAHVRAYPGVGETAYGVRLYKRWPAFMCEDSIDDWGGVTGATSWSRGGLDNAYMVFELGDLPHNEMRTIMFAAEAIEARSSQGYLIQRYTPVSRIDQTCCGPVFRQRVSTLSYFSLAIPGEYRAIPNDIVVGDVYGFFAHVRAYPGVGETAYGVRLYKRWPAFMCEDSIDDWGGVTGATGWSRGGPDNAYMIFELGDLQHNEMRTIMFAAEAVEARSSQGYLIQRLSTMVQGN